mgnify:CR=1 FL=1
MSGEYDDLYFTPGAQEVYVQPSAVPDNAYSSITEIESEYDLDTLIADEYLEPMDYNDDLMYYDGDESSAFDYQYGSSYASNINRFYGNYFNPYWRDPFYYSYGYPSFRYGFSYGYGGFPYYGYNSFYMDPFYRYGGYYGDYYGSYYSGYYPGY